MSGTNEATIAGYCRACGKALAESDVHRSHGALYCKEHAPMEGTAPSPYSGAQTPPTLHNGISPGVAFVLGLIPGVGAIYNGQYAKGVAHVIVVGLAISILNSDAANGFEPLVGLMLVAFWAYMPFDAYHTAQRRLTGESAAQGPHESQFPAVPAFLIGVGVVLLLNNLGLFELRRALRFWPAILIVAGLYMLYTRLSTPSGPGPGSGPGQSAK